MIMYNDFMVIVEPGLHRSIINWKQNGLLKPVIKLKAYIHDRNIASEVETFKQCRWKEDDWIKIKGIDSHQMPPPEISLVDRSEGYFTEVDEIAKDEENFDELNLSTGSLPDPD